MFLVFFGFFPWGSWLKWVYSSGGKTRRGGAEEIRLGSGEKEDGEIWGNYLLSGKTPISSLRADGWGGKRARNIYGRNLPEEEEKPKKSTRIYAPFLRRKGGDTKQKSQKYAFYTNKLGLRRRGVVSPLIERLSLGKRK